MELNDLKTIAENLFHILPQEDFLSKDASDIEVAIQSVANRLASVLMQDFVLPARISQIQAQVADGALLCRDCEHQLRLHKQDQPIHTPALTPASTAASQSARARRRPSHTGRSHSRTSAH